MVFWVVTLCSSERAQYFGGTYGVHLQGWTVSQARNQQKQAANFGKGKVKGSGLPVFVVMQQRTGSLLQWGEIDITTEMASEKPAGAVGKQLATCFCWFLVWLTVQPWRWRQYVLLQHQANSELPSVTSQETGLFVVIMMTRSVIPDTCKCFNSFPLFSLYFHISCFIFCNLEMIWLIPL
jgi:hypothetical protein